MNCGLCQRDDCREHVFACQRCEMPGPAAEMVGCELCSLPMCATCAMRSAGRCGRKPCGGPYYFFKDPLKIPPD